MGHEGVGTVVDAGSSTKLRDGDRVLVSHGGFCGRCRACVNYLSQAHCTAIAGGEVGTSEQPPDFFIDGLAPIERKNDSQSGWAALAQYRLADEGTCTILPDDLDFKYAIAAECAAGMAYCAQDFIHVRDGDRLLLLGSSQRQFSLSHVIVGLFRGAKVIAAVQDDYQEKIVLPKLGLGKKHTRNAVKAKIMIDTQEVIAYSVHLETFWFLQPENKRQAAFMANQIYDREDIIVIGGDFNSLTKGSVDYLEDRLGQEDLQRLSKDTGYTFNNLGVKLTLDHLFASRVEEFSSGVWRDSDASDHFPLWSTVKIDEIR